MHALARLQLALLFLASASGAGLDELLRLASTQEPPELCRTVEAAAVAYTAAGCGARSGARCPRQDEQFVEVRRRSERRCFRASISTFFARPLDVERLFGRHLYAGSTGLSELRGDGPAPAGVWTGINQRRLFGGFSRAAEHALRAPPAEPLDAGWSVVLVLDAVALARAGRLLVGSSFVGLRRGYSGYRGDCGDACGDVCAALRLPGTCEEALLDFALKVDVESAEAAAVSLALFGEAVWVPGANAESNAYRSAISQALVFHTSLGSPSETGPHFVLSESLTKIEHVHFAWVDASLSEALENSLAMRLAAD